MLPVPHALLLDFGGVIADGPVDPQWYADLVEAVNQVLTEAGVAPLPAERIRESLDHDERTDRFWEDPAPRQPDPATMWGEVVAADWPAPARAAVARHGAALSRRFIEAKHGRGWQLRTGMADLLAEAQQRRLPVAVVSNTLSGGPQRDFLAGQGLADRFAVQVYSDEHGVRKPNPALVARALDTLAVPAGQCWFVGDTLSRDVLVARRAGVGAAVLMRSARVEPVRQDLGVAPDAVVSDPAELHQLLKSYW